MRKHTGGGREESSLSQSLSSGSIMYSPAMSAGKDEADVQWKEGVWLGVRMESGESLIGTSEGVAKAREFR